MDVVVTEPLEVMEGLELWPVPGHSLGSLAVYWRSAPGGAAVVAGDALTLWPHTSGSEERVQVAFFQAAPVGREIVELVSRPWLSLSVTQGTLYCKEPIEKLINMESNCARPYAGETAGVWLKRDDSMLLTHSRPPGVLLELVGRTAETHDTVTLRFKGDVSSLPGQSISFKLWIDGRSHTRSYAVRPLPGYIEVTVQATDMVSEYLQNLKLGTRIDASTLNTDM